MSVFLQQNIAGNQTHISVTVRGHVSVTLICNALWITVSQTIPDIFSFSIRIPAAFDLNGTAANSEYEIFREVFAGNLSVSFGKVKLCLSQNKTLQEGKK